MEKSAYVSKTSHLALAGDEYERLYFGNEFCQNLIPDEKELGLAIESAEEKGQRFTLVTPYVTDEGIDRLRPLFRKITEEGIDAEAVVNDWGVLRILRREHKGIEPVLGRLLNKMKRGPRILNVKDRLPKSALSYFQGSNVSIGSYRKMLKKYGIRRVEFDNLLQGIEVDLGYEDTPMRGSLYAPYSYVTTTRLCLTNRCDRIGQADRVGIFPCGKECQRYTFRLTHKDMPVQILLKGNTQFFSNEKIPEGLEAKGIDRLVWQPEIPI